MRLRIAEYEEPSNPGVKKKSLQRKVRINIEERRKNT